MATILLNLRIGFAASCLCLIMASTALADNLLLNSSFKLTTNQVTPDDWDLHHAAALEFQDLYDQYNLDDSQPGPVAGARVLKVTNSERNFYYVYLLSRVPDRKFPVGDYVFSVYVKADRIGNSVNLSPSLNHMDMGTTLRVTRDWQRYSVKYHVDDPDKFELSPMLALPNFGTYWLTAPQLESGDVTTSYAPSRLDAELGVRTPSLKRVAAAAVRDTALAMAAAPISGALARFEFNTYTVAREQFHSRLSYWDVIGR